MCIRDRTQAAGQFAPQEAGRALQPGHDLRLARLVAQGVDEGRGIPQLAVDLDLRDRYAGQARIAHLAQEQLTQQMLDQLGGAFLSNFAHGYTSTRCDT